MEDWFTSEIGTTSLQGTIPKCPLFGGSTVHSMLYFLQFHEYVSGADNSIQDVPVYITVACFLVSEGACLETDSFEGITPFMVCPSEYDSLLKLFARPERYTF